MTTPAKTVWLILNMAIPPVFPNKERAKAWGKEYLQPLADRLQKDHPRQTYAVEVTDRGDSFFVKVVNTRTGAIRRSFQFAETEFIE